MQFGIFTVGDVTTDPTTGRTPTEAERIKAMVAIALQGRGGRPGRVRDRRAPQPAVRAVLADHACSATSPPGPSGCILSTSTTLITTNDPVKIAEDYAMLQHLADGRVDLMMGRGNTGPVYPWFGQDIRDGIALAVENYALLRRLWREDVVDWEGKFRTPLQGFTSTPRPLDGVPPFVWHGSIRSPGDRRAGRVLRRRLLRQQHLLAEGALPAADRALPAAVRALRARHRPTRRSSASAARCSCGRTRRTRCASSGRTSTTRRSTGTARRWRSSPRETPLTVGSPQQVIERTLAFREYVRRLPAPAVPDGPRRPAAEDRAGAARHPRRGGRAGAAQGVRRAAAGRRAGRSRPRTPRWPPAAAAELAVEVGPMTDPRRSWSSRPG